MEIITEILKYGGPTASVCVVGYFIFKEFLRYLKGRDESFITLISNHITHNTEASNNLQKTIAELITWLKRKNGK